MAKAPKKNTIVGVDIGNTHVITTVGTQDAETGELTILGYGKTSNGGMRRGMVVDIDETIRSISNSLEEAERMAGIPIDRALISIGGNHIYSSNSRGVVAVARQGSEVAKEDIDRVIEAAKAFSMPANREVIHVIPKTYIIDGQEGVKDPLGMQGIRLEVDAHVITASSPVVKNILKCAYQAGIDVDEMVYAGLASAKSVLSRKQKEIGVVLIDIGGGGTEITIFEEGDILHSAFIPVGAAHITNDIAIGLRTSIEFAEKVKVRYGAALPSATTDKNMIDLSEIDPNLEEYEVNQTYIIEIINARLEEIFTMVKDELRKIGRDGLLPAGAVLTGGGSKIESIAELARETLRLPAQLGTMGASLQSIDKDIISDPSFTTSIGLILWWIEESKHENLLGGMLDHNAIKSVSNMFKGLFKK